MSNLLENIRRFFTRTEPVTAGIYQYQAPADDPRNYRLHLRVDPDGDGVLIINASTILHLNQTAAEYAYHLVQNSSAEQVGVQMAKRYDISHQQARQDYLDIAERVQILINTPDLDPVTFLDFERQPPLSGHISAPYRLDCALTYRLPEGEDPEAAPSDRVIRELDTDEWKTILDKAWKAGIPHVVFTGGEPTLRQDLVDLIAHAEANGQVSGLLTNGIRFADDDYREQLLQTGLDHVMIVLKPEEEKAWEAVEEAMVDDLFVAVHFTLTDENLPLINTTLMRLADLGIHEISLSANQPELEQSLEAARDQAASLDLNLVWNLPVPYSSLNPVQIEVKGAEMGEGANRAWLYVEPDGDVLATQGDEQALGNFLNDPFEKIFQKITGSS